MRGMLKTKTNRLVVVKIQCHTGEKILKNQNLVKMKIDKREVRVKSKINLNLKLKLILPKMYPKKVVRIKMVLKVRY